MVNQKMVLVGGRVYVVLDGSGLVAILAQDMLGLTILSKTFIHTRGCDVDGWACVIFVSHFVV